ATLGSDTIRIMMGTFLRCSPTSVYLHEKKESLAYGHWSDSKKIGVAQPQEPDQTQCPGASQPVGISKSFQPNCRSPGADVEFSEAQGIPAEQPLAVDLPLPEIPVHVTLPLS